MRISTRIITLKFQLTTSRGGRPIRQLQQPEAQHFNSRPHEEVDNMKVLRTNIESISTHDLTRRSTVLQVLNMNI